MKVTFGKPNISVVPESRKVIYKLPYKINFSYDEGDKETRKLIINTLENLAKIQGFRLEGIVSGVTTCKEDVLDVIVGKRIAESKAKKKIYKYAARVFNKVGYSIINVSYQLTADWQRHEELYDDEIQHFKDLSGLE